MGVAVNTLQILLIVVGFFVFAQWVAAWVRDLVHRGLELLVETLPHPSRGLLATEIDPPCGDVTYVSHFNDLTVRHPAINTACALGAQTRLISCYNSGAPAAVSGPHQCEPQQLKAI
jgi:hypothetical protein